MSDTDLHPPLQAEHNAAVVDRAPVAPRAQVKRDGLSPEALAVVAKPAGAAISPIVLAGFVRMGEFALIMLVGMAVYCVYLNEYDSLIWRYLVATFAVAGLSMLAFQIADIYQVQAFRGHEKQYMRLASAWSVVFLIAIGASFFAKAGEQFSRVWLSAFYITGFVALIAFAPAWCSCWCASGRAKAASTGARSSSAPARRAAT